MNKKLEIFCWLSVSYHYATFSLGPIFIFTTVVKVMLGVLKLAVHVGLGISCFLYLLADVFTQAL